MKKYALSMLCLFLVLPACQNCKRDGGGGDLAKVDGTVLSSKDLSNRARMALFQAEMDYYRGRREAVDQIVTDQILEAEAKKQNLSVDELKRREIDDKVPQATEAEIEDFYSQNKQRIEARMKDIPKGQPKPSEKDIKTMIGKQLAQRRMQERSQAFMAELRQSHKVEYLFEEPKSPKVQIPVTDKNPSKGSPNAKVTIVEFSDFQCPFCARALPTLKEIEKNYGDKVRVVFRHFPLSFHQTARTQAMASACAHDQGKFWDYHDKLFTDQDKLTAAFGGNNEEALRKKLVEFAKDIEMDTAVFSKCLAENKHMDTINDDMRAAEDAGVSSTPSFFVNGQLLAGALPFPEFKKIIDPALGK